MAPACPRVDPGMKSSSGSAHLSVKQAVSFFIQRRGRGGWGLGVRGVGWSGGRGVAARTQCLVVDVSARACVLELEVDGHVFCSNQSMGFAASCVL